MRDFQPLGDRGFLANFDDEAQAQGWAKEVGLRHITGILDIVLAYKTVAIHADPDRADLEELERLLPTISSRSSTNVSGLLLEIPVLYDGEDLSEVASKTNLSTEEIVKLHSNCDYRVQAVGFLPGFPYCGNLPPELSGLARRASPRSRVPTGSVAIAGKQTGIYPAESPGGWHLVGRTPLLIADIDSEFFPIEPGDRIRFSAMTKSEYQERRGERLRSTSRGVPSDRSSWSS